MANMISDKSKMQYQQNGFYSERNQENLVANGSRTSQQTLKYIKSSRKLQNLSPCISRMRTPSSMIIQSQINGLIRQQPNYLTSNIELSNILQRQNQNLKNHCNFLIAEVKKCKTSLKQQKKKSEKYYKKIQELEKVNQQFRKQFQELKDQVFEGLKKIQESICENCMKNIEQRKFNSSLSFTSQDQRSFQELFGLRQTLKDLSCDGTSTSSGLNQLKLFTFTGKDPNNLTFFKRNSELSVKENQFQEKENPNFSLQDQFSDILKNSRGNQCCPLKKNKRIMENFQKQTNVDQNQMFFKTFNISFGQKSTRS